MALSSSGLGRVPLKDEITGSNPVSATKYKLTPCLKAIPAGQGVFFTFFNRLNGLAKSHCTSQAAFRGEDKKGRAHQKQLWALPIQIYFKTLSCFYDR